MGAIALLRALERTRLEFGRPAAARKRELLAALERARLATPGQVLRLHEALCFLRVYPDDDATLDLVHRLLNGFDRRADFRRHTRSLADTGIAGTVIQYRFFAPTARWLAERWPQSLRIDWPEFERQDRLEPLLPLLVHPAETPALDEYADSVRAWLRRLKGPGETDAAFLIRRFAALDIEPTARDIFYDELDPPLILSPGRATPSRTRAGRLPARPVFQRRRFDRSRPNLVREARRSPGAIRAVASGEGQRWVDLAREAMVTRARDLDVFSYGDPRDVRRVACGEGLELIVIGAIPERRLLLESVYGFLVVRNGVPIGYVLTGALFGSCEVAFNVFETFRHAGAAAIYGRVLAAARALFGADTFTIVPFQLGQENDEALDSGAWWFYAKLGFWPRQARARRLAREEQRRNARAPGRRTHRATLLRLADANLYLDLGPPRRDVMGEIPLANVGFVITRSIARRFGAGRELAARTCSEEAAGLLGVQSFRGWPAGERMAWERWAPLVLLLPGLSRWTDAERRALVEVVRAKGGRRESEFVRRFDRHPRLRAALVRIARSAS